MNLIQEIKNKADILDFISKYVKVKKQGRDHVALCPFHKDSHPSMHINVNKQIFKCFACGEGGDVITFYSKYHNLALKDSIIPFAKELNITIPEFNQQPQATREYQAQQVKKLDVYGLMKRVAEFYHQNLPKNPKALSYLHKRGINDASIQRFTIGYASEENSLIKSKSVARLIELDLVRAKGQHHYDFFRHRIIFPIKDSTGNVVGFGGRALDESQQPKYLNSAQSELFNKSKVLYGLFQMIEARVRPEEIIITEGYLDVISLHQAGISNVVCTMGTAFNEEYIKILKKYTDTIVFCFDGDLAGKNAIAKVLPIIMAYVNDNLHFYFLLLPFGEDPDSLIQTRGSEAFHELLTKAKLSLSNYLLEYHLPINDSHDLDKQAIAIKLTLDLVHLMPQSTKKTMLESKLLQIITPVHFFSPKFLNNKLNKRYQFEIADEDFKLNKAKNAARFLVFCLLNIPTLALEIDMLGYSDILRKEEQILLSIVNFIQKSGDKSQQNLIGYLFAQNYNEDLQIITDNYHNTPNLREDFLKNWISFEKILIRRKLSKQTKASLLQHIS